MRLKLTFAVTIDVAVRILSDIWSTRSIPDAFLPLIPQNSSIQARVPSVTPASTGMYPLESHAQTAFLTSLHHTPVLKGPAYDHNETADASSLRWFVHAVLEASRPEVFELQAAMCYVAGVARSVIDLQSKTHASREKKSSNTGVSSLCSHAPDRRPPKVCPPDASLARLQSYEAVPVQEQAPMSPLRDPRRTFIAALMLAFKFNRDFYYPNRAWANLVNVSPRETSP